MGASRWRALAGKRGFAMRVDVRPAMPVALPRSSGLRAGRERRTRWIANAVTAVTAAVAIMIVGIAAVMLGLT
jgi:hypothetical protein